MKYFNPLFISFLLGLCITSYAQTNPSNRKALATGQRLIAQGYYEKSGAGVLTLVDSARYFYTGTRGSRFNYNTLRYVDLPYLGTAPIVDYLNIPSPITNIDSNYYPTVDFDSATAFLNIGQTVPTPFVTTEVHTYNAAGALDSVSNRVFDLTGTQQYGQRTVNVYTGGKLTRVYVSNYNTATYDTSFIRDFKYDGLGRLVLDSVSARLPQFSAWSKVIYTYGSGAGYTTATYYAYKPSPSRLEPVGRISNTYNGSGQVRTSYSEQYYPSIAAFKPTGLDSFGYSGSVLGHTYLRQQILDTAGATQYTYYTTASHVNAAGQKDSVTFLGYQGAVFIGGNSTSIVYNSDGNPARRNEYNLNLNLISSEFAREYYYYEPIPAAAVANSAVINEPIIVYPNPTSGLIQLKMPSSLTGNTISIQVTDLAGRLVHRESLTVQHINESVAIGAECIPGQYLMVVRDRSGNTLYSGTIIKK